MYKVIVAHPGKQHSFQTAIALKNSGMLCKYITTVYDKRASFLMKVAKSFLPQKESHQAESRRTDALEDGEVLQFCELLGLVEIVLSRVDKKRRLYRKWHNFTAARFGRRVARYAVRVGADAVIMYDTTAKACFEYLEKAAPQIKRIMDCSAANRLYMRGVYEKDKAYCGPFSKRLTQERGHLNHPPYLRFLAKELKATQYFLAPSGFVKKSLTDSGIDPDAVYVCPYGTNFIPACPENKNTASDGKLKAVYVGNVTQMKGVYYLLEASKRLKECVSLTLVGGYDNRDGLFDSYFDTAHFVGKVPHDAVKSYLCNADVFVFPSLGEGLSLSCLEAMSCALPCILSENSGANDAVTNGVNGFVIKPHSVEAVEQALLWCCQNRERLHDMGLQALETSKQYTWTAYGAHLATALRDILGNEE